MVQKGALLVIDMQVALFEVPGNPTYREQELVVNIQTLVEKAHKTGTPVIYIQHQDKSGPLQEETRGWQLLPVLTPVEGDVIVAKYAEDSFYRTRLDAELQARAIRHLVICGCRSDYCVDATCRSAVSHDYDVTLVSDAHSTINRKVLNAQQIVAHHTATLDGFGPEEHRVVARSTADVVF